MVGSVQRGSPETPPSGVTPDVASTIPWPMVMQANSLLRNVCLGDDIYQQLLERRFVVLRFMLLAFWLYILITFRLLPFWLDCRNLLFTVFYLV